MADAVNADTLGCTCARLRKLARRVTSRYDQRLAAAGLRVTQFSLLATLRRNPGLTVTDLARLMGMDRTTLVRNLKPLVDAGHIEVADADAGNARAVRITAAGRAAWRAAVPLWREAQAQTAAQIGRANLRALHVLLDDALGRLDDV